MILARPSRESLFSCKMSFKKLIVIFGFLFIFYFWNNQQQTFKDIFELKKNFEESIKLSRLNSEINRDIRIQYRLILKQIRKLKKAPSEINIYTNVEIK